MSNLIAGEIFDKIIQEVVQASQTDFEENGVNQQTLVELEQTWQQKLTVRAVAQMPWDPKPEPSPQPAPAHSQMPQTHSVPSYAPSQSQQPVYNGARIKSEAAPEQAYNNGANYMPQPMNPELAQQRAASLLQQQYGSQATASLGAMHQRGIALPGQQQGKPNLQLPGQSQSIQYSYAQQMKQQQQAQQARIKTETDGAGDEMQPFKRQRLTQDDTNEPGMAEWQAYMAARRAVTDEQRAQNDATMRQYVSDMSSGLESGLMQPLRQAKPTRKGRAARASRPRLEGIPQLDGDFSDDEKAKEEDEDAINSDLDDVDELDNADEDDEEVDSMLCTYDKVQRVKNKWKCTLKDGVLSANGKEYLFHKAQGEFEW